MLTLGKTRRNFTIGQRPYSVGVINMAKSKENIGTKKIDTLVVGEKYAVKWSGFKKVSGKRGDFMSASFLCEDNEGNKFFVSTPSERSAYKAIGVITGTKINGNKTSISSLEVVENGNYKEFVYELTEYVPEINEDEFEPL